MPKVIDPDNLSRNVSVIWSIADTLNRRIGISASDASAGSLIPPLESGSDSGVSFQTLYSFAKEQWKGQSDLIKIPFPFISITPNQFDIQNNWDFYDDSSRYLMRDAGWSVISASITTHEYHGIRTLGDLGFDAATNSGDQVYYTQSGSAAGAAAQALIDVVQNFPMSGAVNMAILAYSASRAGAVTTVDRNFRGETVLYVREYKKIYDDASIQSDLGVTTQTYTLYSVPLQNSVDLKITTTTEADAATDGPYNFVYIYFFTGSGYTSFGAAPATLDAGYVLSGSDGTWFITNNGGTKGTVAPPGTPNGTATYTPYVHLAGAEPISGSYVISSSGEYTVFDTVVVNGTGSAAQTGSISNVYTAVQYDLRQNVDIDDATMWPAGTFIGKTTRVLLSFVGDTLITSDGVYLLNYQDADTNSIDFYDVSGSLVRFPFVATGVISFNDNLQAEAIGSGSYWMFFTSVPSGQFGSASAIIVNNNAGNPITGSIDGQASVSFNFDYDGNVQGGRTPATDAPVTVVAIGLESAQYVTATTTIERTKTNNVSLVAALERNYLNPA